MASNHWITSNVTQAGCEYSIFSNFMKSFQWRCNPISGHLGLFDFMTGGGLWLWDSVKLTSYVLVERMQSVLSVTVVYMYSTIITARFFECS